MIFQFPDLETFRLAVTSAQVPPEVSAAPAEVAFDPEGRPSVRSAAGIPPKAMQNALRKLGVKQTKEHFSETILTVDCWPQIIPVSKGKAELEITSNTPVLFEMPSSEFASVVTEMLRLGNDRQSFRTIAPAHGHGERVLVKVIGPPYYTLLRAIDKQTQSGANIVAYLERSPRVWVEIGHEHPLAGIVKPADGQVLLLRPERDWTVVADGTFQDIYDVLDFQLPSAAVEWQESQLKGKLAVPLRLSPGNAADVAELWVLTEDAVDQLDSLVRDADERLMARLLFAVAQEGNQTTIVLKTRPSRLDPPVLSLSKAHAFKPYWKLPNLFLPVGKRLLPTLRRDAVRRLLANNSAQVVWLMPSTDGKFTPEVLPDEAFRPLEDWIDYIIDHEHAPLAAWVQATRFDFDSFICPEDQPDKPKGPPPERTKKPKKPKGEPAADDADLPPIHLRGNKPKGTPGDEAEFALPVEVVAPSEVKVKLRELEQEFVAMEGPLDSPERQAIWPKMARLNTLDGRELEAAICWTNAFWELPDVPVEGAWAWLQGEDKRARKVPTGEEFEAAMEARDQSPTTVRTLAARVLYACKLSPVPDTLFKRLPTIREYLEQHDGMLGARAAWLTWWHLARAGGQTDVLALARVHDRLLQRLLAEGLNKERDLPYFLRTAGEQNSEHLRVVRDRAMTIHKLVEKWHAGEDVRVNKPYIDFMFAFGFASIREVTLAKEFSDRAIGLIASGWHKDAQFQRSHEVLAKAFDYRIRNAIDGKPHTGRLPQALIEKTNALDVGRNPVGGVNPKYVVDRFVEQSWILEPQEAINPYNQFKTRETSQELAMDTIHNPREMRTFIERSIKELGRDGHGQLVAYSGFARYVHRAGEEYALTFVSKIPDHLFTQVYPKSTDATESDVRNRRAELLARIVILAAHYGAPVLVDQKLNYVYQLLNEKIGVERYEIVNQFAYRSLRSLRKLGLKEQIERLLNRIQQLVEKGNSLMELRRTSGNMWADVLGSLVSVAYGWQFMGLWANAKPYLDEARSVLTEQSKLPPGKGGMGAQNLTKLAIRYIGAVCQGPVSEALDQIENLFANIGKIPNGFSTAPFYSRLHLNIVEEVIRSVMSETFAIGEKARAWLDDDEFLVRRRIHKDMKGQSAQSGI